MIKVRSINQAEEGYITFASEIVSLSNIKSL